MECKKFLEMGIDWFDFIPIDHRDLERIYELTYKYQLLNQEAALGDYGLPQTLADRAYMELARAQSDLNEA